MQPDTRPSEAASEATDREEARRRQAQDERELVSRAQKGDAGAYEILVRRHQQRIFAVVGGILRRSGEVEDIAQQVFLKAYLSLKRFDQRAAFGTWLYKIAVNECWDFLRKKKVRPLLYEADLSEDQSRQMTGAMENSAAGSGGDIRKRLELREQIERLFEAIDERDRLMLILKEVEGFSVEEIGEILDLNVNTVKVRLFRARGRLVKLHRRLQKNEVGRTLARVKKK